MNLDPHQRKAIQDLGDAINSAVEKSLDVKHSIERIRAMGYDASIALNLEIGLIEMSDTIEKEPEIEFTDEDVRALQRMKIRIDDVE
jgi:pentose-5-phosphate-3-epimerase